MKFLAIDIGASGGKAFVGDLGNGSFQVRELRRFPNSIMSIDGRMHWDIPGLFEEIKRCLADAPDVDSIGIDTWGVDYGYVDRNGDLIGLPFAYRDSRTDKSIPWVHDRIPRNELYSITGIQFLPFNPIYQVADDLLSSPSLVDNSKRLLMIPELLSYLLTGREISEYTNASTTGLLDVHSRAWSNDILDRIGFPKELLPPVVQPATKTVDLLPEIRRETGCRATLSFIACHDTASAVAAIPADGSGWAFISSGTWSLVGMELDHPILSDSAREANFTNEGGAGDKIRFLTNVTGMWLLDELRKSWSRRGIHIDLGAIMTEAEKSPSCGVLVDPDHPIFRSPDDMLDAIRQYCAETGQKAPDSVGPLARLVFESLASAYKDRIDRLRDLTGKTIDRIHIVGGGSLNRLLCRMTADACGVPVIAGPDTTTAIGNILMQAVAKGVVSNLGEARSIAAGRIAPKIFKPAARQ